jgi:hypothetical protein
MAMDRLGTVDGAIEALVDQRLACLDVLIDCREQLRPRWSNRHSRRRSSVDEAPFPEPVPEAQPVDGVDLRSIAITILRRHGPQRLRELHGLIHLYGYRIHSERPVQRLGDAMAYELRQGRAERLERGVYGALDPHRGPGRYVPPPADLGTIFPWDRPLAEPGPPHLDPDVANDPELWSRAEWPTEEDLPAEPAEDRLEPDPPDSSGRDPHALTPDKPPPPSTPVGVDSSTNRRPVPPEWSSRWRWEPPP